MKAPPIERRWWVVPMGVSLALAVLAAQASATMPPSANGSGHIIVNGELRTFSFAARQESDGLVVGTAEINNRAIGEMFQLDLDCLKIVGNMAVVSGVFSRHTDPNAIGLTGIFGVIDAGEGSGDVDAVSQVFFFPPNTLTCQDIDPADNAELAVPIVAGNIQVH
jgi:hypothetical protein